MRSKLFAAALVASCLLSAPNADALFAGDWWNATKSAASTTVGKVSSMVSAGYDQVKQMGAAGATYLKTQALEIWNGLKSFDCGRVVDAFSNIDPTTVLLEKAWAPAGTCVKEFRKGALCGIPDMVKALGSLAYNSATTAWANKSTCLTAAAATGPLAPGVFMGCGLFLYGKAQFTKIGRCLKSMEGNKFWKMLWEEGWKLGCNIAGSVAMDVVLTTLSAGAGLPATIAKWVTKLSTKLSPAVWLKVAKEATAKTVDAAVAYTQAVAGRLSECK